jgi:hypothetical protein
MEKIILTRKHLYDLVWSEPLSRLAKRYNISDNGLRKICKRMDIPIPAKGHWQKVRYGKPVTVAGLPENYSGEGEITLDEKGTDDDKTNSPVAVLRRLSRKIGNNPDLTIIVPDRLIKPDKLIISTMNYHEAVRRYYKSHHGNHPDRIDVLNIDVKEENRPRAYRIMDTIIKSLRARIHDVKIRYFNTYVVIEGEEIKFRLRERQRVSDVKNSWGGRQYESTGELVFVLDLRAYHRKEVSDGTDGLETKISTIIAMLELEGKRRKEDRIAHEEYRKAQAERERIEGELNERKDREMKHFLKLFRKARSLHYANILRTYVRTVESNAIQSHTLSEELKAWIVWATDKISWFDPLVRHEDPLLDDDDRKTLYKCLVKESD